MVKFIKKPWGDNAGEYVIYSNPNVEVKRLYLEQNHCTSLHCHPKKKTGLVVLSGLIKLEFLSSSLWLEPGQKVMIRAGVFHRSNAYLDSQLLEIENPVDKDDLVRLECKYSRGQGYELNSFELDLPVFDFNILNINDIVVTHKHISTNFDINNKYAILSGGIYANFNGKVYVLGPGDLVDGKVIKELSNKFNTEEMEVLEISSNK